MGFSLQLAQDLVEVEPGTTIPVTLSVVNRGSATDRFEVEVEGVDPEWKAIPVPSFSAEPGETHNERFFFKPARTTESLAGNYPFVVRIRSLESGEQKTAQGVLRVKPYHHLSMEIDPKKGAYSPTSKHNVFDVTVVNLGNTEHTIQLVGSDPEDDCTYEFENEQVTLGPGQQREVSMTVRPASSPVFSSGKLIGFSVAGRSIDAPSVVATTQAQLEQRALISPSLLAIALLLGIIFAAWILMMPKEPVVTLSVNPVEVTAGQPVTVSWKGHDANRVEVSAVDGSQQDSLNDQNQLEGSGTFTPTSPGRAEIIAIPYKDQRQGARVLTVIDVQKPPEPIKPVIDSFSIKPSARKVPRGSTVTFKWAVTNADKVSLAPVALDLNPDLAAYQLTVKDDGDYWLVATSKDGTTARSSTIHISVYDVSDAKILAFTADPTSVEANGVTTLTWQVTNAVRVELHEPGGKVQVVEQTSGQPYQVTAKSTFTLVAYDQQGRTASRDITVQIKQPPPPPVTTPPGTTDTATTGISTTGTPPATTGAATGGPH